MAEKKYLPQSLMKTIYLCIDDPQWILSNLLLINQNNTAKLIGFRNLLKVTMKSVGKAFEKWMRESKVGLHHHLEEEVEIDEATFINVKLGGEK